MTVRDWGQFEKDGVRDEAAAGRSTACQVCEAMLPDAVDGLLSEAEQRAFERHVAGCAVCSQELEEAQRGAAWLGMLKQQPPEPAPALLERILAQTSGQTAALPGVVSAALRPAVEAAAPGAPASAPAAWIAAPVRPRVPAGQASRWAVWARLTGAPSSEWLRNCMRPMLQPRLVMTAAMAFFSIAVTLNLTGVRLQEVHASLFTPAGMRRAVADRSAAAVRSFQNMRVVYQAEAQVHDLRESWQSEPVGAPAAGAPQNEPDTQPDTQPNDRRSGHESGKPDMPQGSSRLESLPLVPQENSAERKGA